MQRALYPTTVGMGMIGDLADAGLIVEAAEKRIKEQERELARLRGTNQTRRGDTGNDFAIMLSIACAVVGITFALYYGLKKPDEVDVARQEMVAKAVERARVYAQEAAQARSAWEAALPRVGQPVLFETHPAIVLERVTVNPQIREATFRLRVTMPAGYSEVTAFLNEIQIQAEKPR
jgi:hypothetical protein